MEIAEVEAKLKRIRKRKWENYYKVWKENMDAYRNRGDKLIGSPFPIQFVTYASYMCKEYDINDPEFNNW